MLTVIFGIVRGCTDSGGCYSFLIYMLNILVVWGAIVGLAVGDVFDYYAMLILIGMNFLWMIMLFHQIVLGKYLEEYPYNLWRSYFWPVGKVFPAKQ
jgi:hypothetical protein